MNESGMQNFNQHCTGCGVTLQSEKPGEAGYAPAAARAKERVICQRCYKLKHYNELSAVTVDPSEFNRMLHQIGSAPSVIVHIVDVFDFEGSLITGLHRYGQGNPILLAVNKLDLLPRDVHPHKLEQWIRRQLKHASLKVEDVVMISAETGQGFDQLTAALNELHSMHPDGDIYVVGATNAGKSSVINRLIRDNSDLDEALTTSRYPGTTLDLIHIPLDNGRHLIDTPGLVLDDRFSEIVPPHLLKTVLPDKAIKPKVYQLEDKQTLFFGAFARFDFVRGERQSFTCYVSNAVPIHRTKLEKADEFFESHGGELLSPPNRSDLADMPPLTIHTFRIEQRQKPDVFISGLGWIKVNGEEGAIIEVHAPRGIKVLIREPMI